MASRDPRWPWLTFKSNLNVWQPVEVQYLNMRLYRSLNSITNMRCRAKVLSGALQIDAALTFCIRYLSIVSCSCFFQYLYPAILFSFQLQVCSINSVFSTCSSVKVTKSCASIARAVSDKSYVIIVRQQHVNVPTQVSIYRAYSRIEWTE